MLIGWGIGLRGLVRMYGLLEVGVWSAWKLGGDGIDILGCWVVESCCLATVWG